MQGHGGSSLASFHRTATSSQLVYLEFYVHLCPLPGWVVSELNAASLPSIHHSAHEGGAPVVKNLSEHRVLAMAAQSSRPHSNSPQGPDRSRSLRHLKYSIHLLYIHVYPPTLPRLGQGRAAPGTTVGVERCFLSKPPSTVPLPLTCFRLQNWRMHRSALNSPPLSLFEPSPRPRAPWL